MKTLIGIISLFLLVMFGIILFIWLVVSPIMWVTCKNYTSITGTETKYSFIQGECFLKMQGKWIPYEKWVNISGTVK